LASLRPPFSRAAAFISNLEALVNFFDLWHNAPSGQISAQSLQRSSMNLQTIRARLEGIVRRANTVPEGLQEPVPTLSYKLDVTGIIMRRSLNFDLAQVLQVQAVIVGTHDVFRTMARQADEALSRMDKGIYGICAACEEPISDKRIAAVPWSPLCTDCQELADRHELPDFEYLANNT
jgi:RNA polymerase-binding transcription factor DksA